MGKEKTFILLTFLIGMVTAQFNNTCKTPDKQEGIYVDIYDCPMLLYLLKDADKNATAKTFLQQSYCGSDEKNNTKVCCSSEGDIIPPQTMCGKPQIITNRIVGGNPAPLGTWPWIAALGYTQRGVNGTRWNCGGTLISKRHVLTAAHCVYGLNQLRKQLSVVRLGDLDLNPNINDGASPLDVPVQSFSIHQAYNRIKMVSDIALVKLAQAVTYTELIQPVKLTSIRYANDLNHMAFVAGWGYTGDMTTNGMSNPNTVLMEVQVPLMPTKDCQQAYSKTKTAIDYRVLCAGTLKGGIDSCQGDSGGPLMLLRDNQFILIGVVSYGHMTCGTPGIPGVYTNVAVHMQWVYDQVKS